MKKKLIAYECGELSIKETTELFSKIIKSGEVFSMNSKYIEKAAELINIGIIDENGNINEEVLKSTIQIEKETFS